jgi:hypothetical protein
VTGFPHSTELLSALPLPLSTTYAATDEFCAIVFELVRAGALEFIPAPLGRLDDCREPSHPGPSHPVPPQPAPHRTTRKRARLKSALRAAEKAGRVVTSAAIEGDKVVLTFDEPKPSASDNPWDIAAAELRKGRQQ